MILYADLAGAILDVRPDSWEREPTDEWPSAVPGAMESLVVDAATNPRLARFLWQYGFQCRLSGGALTHQGQPVTVNPPGGAWRAAEEQADAQSRILAAIKGALADYETALTHWDGLTQAQLKAVVKRLVEVQVQLLRYHRREVL